MIDRALFRLTTVPVSKLFFFGKRKKNSIFKDGSIQFFNYLLSDWTSLNSSSLRSNQLINIQEQVCDKVSKAESRLTISLPCLSSKDFGKRFLKKSYFSCAFLIFRIRPFSFFFLKTRKKKEIAGGVFENPSSSIFDTIRNDRDSWQDNSKRDFVPV